MRDAPPRICTVALGSELAHARVLARSLGTADPAARLWVLLLDAPGQTAAGDEPFEPLLPADVGLSAESFGHLAALLPPPMLRAVARAWLLRSLWLDDGAPLIYLDPTSRVYASLEDIAGLLGEHDLLLNPTLTAPLVADGSRPGPAEIASWGAYDGGLVGVGAQPSAGRVLEWWAESSAEQGRGELKDSPGSELGWWIEEEQRTHTTELVPAPGSQVGRLLDLAAGMAESPVLLSDPGFNAGYWNLAGRELAESEPGYEVDGRPLRTLNFRGFDPRRPSLLSLHQDRISLAEQPELARLCAVYAAELAEQGAADCAELGYAFERLPDGTRFSARLRGLYRQWSDSGAISASVFSERGQRAFFDWLREPPGPGPAAAANRFLFAVYLERPDLQRAIPIGAADFGPRLADWARTSGREEIEIPDELIPVEEPGPVTAAPAQRPPGSRITDKIPFDSWGVNVIGFHRLDFGIAEAGRLAIEALDQRSIPLLPIHDLSLGRYKAPGPPFATLGLDAAAFPINLLCMNGDHTVDLARRFGSSIFEQRYNIGLWFWEADRLPDSWLPAFDLLDEVWAPSAFVAETVSPVSPVPVSQIRLPISALHPPALDRAAYGIGEEDFLFLYVFDFDSVGTRKNPIGAVDAFKRAFPPGSGATLLLKSSFSRNAVSQFEALRLAAAEHPDIRVVDRRVSGLERDALIAGCDCYLSLHRSEGFGLTPAEAMLSGRPVIATGYGGNTDFMNGENSYLVDYQLIPVGEGLFPYPAEAHWADPDLDQAAELMRHVFENREEARRRGLQAAESLRRSHSAEAAGRIMEERLVGVRRRFLREAAPHAPESRSLPQRVLARLRGGRPPKPAEAESQLPALSAALMAQTREQERRVRELEQTRAQQDDPRLRQTTEP